MTPLTQPCWERFALAYFSGKSRTESARIAGIPRRSATRLARNGAVLARIKELQEAAASDKIISVVQRKVRPSEMARAHECPIQAIAEITNRHFGRTRIELDQRVKAEIGMLSASDYLQALREAEKVTAEWMGYPNVQAMRQDKMHDHIARLEAGLLESPERQLPSPTREPSHEPVSDAPSCEGEIA
jgi:hypothetical protein